ncbi:MAG: M20/M25/M40 family metallo-hydrolase [Pseudoflavonifractor sp.]|nr:M20/M25/M40 family metallo-hydrolase [Pseudoflavonifractor sp.]MDY3018911.1 M20/M25/M40 family metallo-hydrolase [Oscillospiraceae bacterium]
METFDLIARLTAIHGPSGREGAVAAAIAGLARPFADDITTDTLGNLIVHRKGSGPKVMFAAHMDSIGLVATYLEENGAVRFGKLGGVQPQNIRNVPVRFENGVLGAVKVNGKADEDKLTMDDLYLDIGAASREEAAALVKLGDTAVYATAAGRTGNRVISPYLDNRVSCAVLLMALERLESRENDLYFVFTVQEEVGLRGAKTAAYVVDPEFAVDVDVTGAYDYPGASRAGSAALGKGAAVKVMDTSVICHPQMVEKLSALAVESEIPYQIDVLTRGGTDAGAIHQSRLGVITGGISIPCRYTHTPTETVDLSDVEACARLAAAFAQCKL